MSDEGPKQVGYIWVDYGSDYAYVAESYDDIESGRGIDLGKQDLEKLLRYWPK